MKKKEHHSKYSIGKPYGSYSHHSSNDGDLRWTKGHFINWKHTVLVYADSKYIQLSIYVNGIGYYKSISVKSHPSDLSLSRQASKFSSEITKNNLPKHR